MEFYLICNQSDKDFTQYFLGSIVIGLYVFAHFISQISFELVCMCLLVLFSRYNFSFFFCFRSLYLAHIGMWCVCVAWPSQCVSGSSRIMQSVLVPQLYLWLLNFFLGQYWYVCFFFSMSFTFSARILTYPKKKKKWLMIIDQIGDWL